jgi:hypothetical protein
VRKIFISISFILLFFSVFAQQAKVKKEVEKKGIIYSKEFSGGAYVATNGWGIMMEHGKIKSIKKTRLMYWSFGELRDMRMRKQNADLGFFGSAPGNESPKDFFFGRQNNFYALRFGLGQKKVLGDKAEKNGVRVGLTYTAGLALGFLKPYYLNLAYLIDDSDPRFQTYAVFTQKYSERNADKFLDWYSIAGASGFKYGLKEIEPVPGGFGKIGLNFDWGKIEEMQMALEVGVMADVYYKRVPIMVADNNKPYFLGAYIQFQFGKRKY